MSVTTVRGKAHSSAVRVGEHWDQPMHRGPASLEGPPSLLSQWSKRSLQGLTCEKKTKSILVKAADLYSK